MLVAYASEMTAFPPFYGVSTQQLFVFFFVATLLPSSLTFFCCLLKKKNTRREKNLYTVEVYMSLYFAQVPSVLCSNMHEHYNLHNKRGCTQRSRHHHHLLFHR